MVQTRRTLLKQLGAASGVAVLGSSAVSTVAAQDGDHAAVRVGHLSPDAPAMDVYINKQPDGNPSMGDVEYPEFRPDPNDAYVALPTGGEQTEYDVTLVPADDQIGLEDAPAGVGTEQNETDQNETEQDGTDAELGGGAQTAGADEQQLHNTLQVDSGARYTLLAVGRTDGDGAPEGVDPDEDAGPTEEPGPGDEAGAPDDVGPEEDEGPGGGPPEDGGPGEDAGPGGDGGPPEDAGPDNETGEGNEENDSILDDLLRLSQPEGNDDQPDEEPAAQDQPDDEELQLLTLTDAESADELEPPQDAAEVRFVHASPGAGTVDINVDDETVAEGVEFGDDSEYETFDDPGQVTIEVVRATGDDVTAEEPDVEGADNETDTGVNETVPEVNESDAEDNDTVEALSLQEGNDDQPDNVTGDQPDNDTDVGDDPDGADVETADEEDVVLSVSPELYPGTRVTAYVTGIVEDGGDTATQDEEPEVEPDEGVENETDTEVNETEPEGNDDQPDINGTDPDNDTDAGDNDTVEALSQPDTQDGDDGVGTQDQAGAQEDGPLVVLSLDATSPLPENVVTR